MLTTFHMLSPIKTTPFPLIMEVTLTVNAISLLLVGSIGIQPLLQIVELALLSSTKTTSQRYRISLSDSTSQHRTLLPFAYNGHVICGALELGSIIILKEVTCTFLQNYAYVHSSPYPSCFSVPSLYAPLSLPTNVMFIFSFFPSFQDSSGY